MLPLKSRITLKLNPIIRRLLFPGEQSETQRDSKRYLEIDFGLKSYSSNMLTVSTFIKRRMDGEIM